MNYEFLEHTADAKFRAYGRTLEEAFMNSAYAMLSILKGDINIKKKMRREINVKSSSDINLLHDFLEEFLFLIDTESLLLSTIEHLEIDENLLSISCIAYFDKIQGYDISGDIKSVTYSEMEIIRDKGKVVTQVVVDI